MLVRMDEILKKAKKERYGVAAPNVYNDISVKACYETADKLKSPIILDCAGLDVLEETADIVRFYERKYPNVVAALNLDHGGSFEEIMHAIKYGFTSVMIDRSTLEFDDNVKEVKEVVKIAHAADVSVEAELGHVGQGFEYEETRDAGLTKKEDALKYIELTGVDCLAVAVGTSHGTYKGTPHLEFELLDELNRAIDIPLVLHGGSGTGDENLKKAVETGIQKVNLFTDLSTAALNSMVKYLDFDWGSVKQDGSKGEFGNLKANLCDISVAAKEGFSDLLEHYIKLFGSNEKA